MLPTQYVTQSTESVKAHMYILYQIVVLVQTRIHTIYTYTYCVNTKEGGGGFFKKKFFMGGGKRVMGVTVKTRKSTIFGTQF